VISAAVLINDGTLNKQSADIPYHTSLKHYAILKAAETLSRNQSHFRTSHVIQAAMARDACHYLRVSRDPLALA
jgi:hypothetical protein